jgi:hypothetical protein
MSGYTPPGETSTITKDCYVNDYISKMQEILVQLLDKKDKKQTLARLANLKEQIEKKLAPVTVTT